MMPPGSRASLADGFSLTGDDVWSSLLVLLSSGAAQAFAGQFDAVGVVNEPVQDGVGVGGVAYNPMPAIHGKLGGDHRGAAAVALLEDFEEIVTGGRVERLEPPVFADQEIGAAETVSLGADGALFVDRETALAAALPAKKALSTVGAGDAMSPGLPQPS